MTHAGAANDCGVEIVKIDSEDIDHRNAGDFLGSVAGVIIPGGFGDRGVEGKICACRYAREHRIPYLGLCLGMQVATIEFARSVCGLKEANSTEFDGKSRRSCDLSARGTERGAKQRSLDAPRQLAHSTYTRYARPTYLP
jgi:CTP synthase